MVGIVYVALDGNVSQILTVKVKKGDSVSAIQKKIKKELLESNIFALYAPAQIEVFQSKVSQSGNKLEADDTPLDGRKKWDSKVTWGTEEQPLIVYSPRNDITRATQIATADTAAMDSFVYYRLIINEKPRRVTTIKVKEGEYIDSIIRGIKLQESPAYDSVPASSIELFESPESTEPLHALTKWNMDVTWGKPETPLIVRVQPLAIAPGNNNSEVAQRDDVFTAAQIQQLTGALAAAAFGLIPSQDGHAISSVSVRMLKKVTDAYGIRTETPKWNRRSDVSAPSESDNFSYFRWNDAQESNPNQRRRYKDYLDQISWPQNYTLFDASKEQLFINVPLANSQFNGNIDLILLSNNDSDSIDHGNKIRLGIELKKPPLTKKHHVQACIEHLCAAILNYENSVLTLLTDLKDSWIFIYFGSGKKMYKLKTSRNEAKFLLDNMFNQNELEQSKFPEDFVNRLTWNQFKESLTTAVTGTHFPDRDNNDDSENNEEEDEDDSQNLKKQEENPRNRSADAKGDRKGSRNNTGHAAMAHFGGDVANELDLLDFIDNEEEKKQIVMKYVLDNVVPMLQFSDSADEKEQSSSSSSSSSSRHVLSSQRQQDDKSFANDFVSSCDDSFLELSEQNLMRHNAGALGTPEFLAATGKERSR